MTLKKSSFQLIVNFPERPPLKKSSIKTTIRMAETLTIDHNKAKVLLRQPCMESRLYYNGPHEPRKVITSLRLLKTSAICRQPSVPQRLAVPM